VDFTLEAALNILQKRYSFMAEEIAIRVENVSKNFVLPHERISSVKSLVTSAAKRRARGKTETQHALRNISFEVKKGEFFGIVGRNGSGKSTLLKILAGIYQPTTGKVSASGKLVPFIELGVGFNPELTGRENVFLNGAMLGFSQKDVGEMYEDIVAFAELERFMDQKLKNYSSGMQVRLAFSMATRAKADILLIDEVLAVGDADFQRKCFDYFKQLKKNKQTVVFVSHDMEAIREYCDRAVLIDDSSIKFFGSTERITQEYIKLFAEPNPEPQGEDSDNRWGDSRIKIEEIACKVSPDAIIIIEKIKAYEDTDAFIAGIRIRSAAGLDIAGTNTKIESVKTTSLKKGNKLTITWTIPNVLSDGVYSIDPAVAHDNGIDMYDWWNDAQTFTVKKKRHLPYPIDPNILITVSKADD
jgi:ABC-2 type transport system ATP-binding protein